jgi:hypothetical protein
MSEWTITLVVSTTGQSETITVPSSTSLVEVVDWAKALFGLAGDHGPLSLFLDGKRLQVTNDDTLQSAGCNNGDVIAVQEAAAASARAAAPSASNALDFSTLLSGAPPSQQQQVSSSSSGGLDFSRLLQQAPTSTTPPAPVYWNGMNVSEATQYNPHPHAFVSIQLVCSIWCIMFYNVSCARICTILYQQPNSYSFHFTLSLISVSLFLDYTPPFQRTLDKGTQLL